MRALVQVLLYIHAQFRLMLSLIWFHLNAAVFVRLPRRLGIAPGWASPAPPPPNFRIALIGDGLAAGFGDWVTLGWQGGGQRLQRLLRSNAVSGLRGRWTVVDCGVKGSTTADWLPTGRCWGHWPEAVDLFVVLLGREELAQVADADEAAAVAERLRTIADALEDEHTGGEDEDGVVRVFTTTVTKNGTQGGAGVLAAANAALRKRFEDAGQLAVEVDGRRYDEAQLHNTRDFIHLSSKGYQQLAKDLAIGLAPALRKIEFQGWKRLLAGNA